MKIETTLLGPDQLKALYDDPMQLNFGRLFTDYMFLMRYNQEQGWHQPQIKSHQPLAMDPGALIFHYCQEVFEGLKGYLSPQDEILLFRPEENARRMIRSMKRMCIPEFTEEIFLEAVETIVKLEKRWIPNMRGASLYIRPTVIASEVGVGLRPSNEYLFFIILSPVGPYYKSGFNPVGLLVLPEFVRAVKGGVGEAKTGANYAASLLAARMAGQAGFDQVLWLDAIEHRYVEEVGSMNIFFVINNKLVTPALNGSILPGITRKSVLQMAPALGLEAEERPISIDEVVAGIKSGELSESFGSGTAAVITPVGHIRYQEKTFTIGDNKTGSWTQKFFDQLTSIQYGLSPDPYQWVHKIV